MSEVAHTVVTGNEHMEWNLSNINLREITISFCIKNKKKKKITIKHELKISKYSSKKKYKKIG
jgi:hypothetical protein